MKRVRVKICGVTRPEDAEAAARLGADAIGLNFHPGSPRCVKFSGAKEILRVLPSFVEPVAVVVAEPLRQAESLVDALRDFGLRHIQVHQTAATQLFPTPAANWRCLAAFGVADHTDLERIQTWVKTRRIKNCPLSGLLVDAKAPGLHGGTGQTAPWDLLAGFDPGVSLILAGGLTPDNVAQAIRIVQPWAVDVASGVESAPGVKDQDKIRRFIENALGAER